MIDLKYFQNVKLIRQERKILENLREKFFKKHSPMGYPSSIILSEKIQSNTQTPEVITVYNELLEIENEISLRILELNKQEIQILNTIRKIKDITIKNTLYARYFLNLSFKEILKEYDIRKQDFFNKLKIYKFD